MVMSERALEFEALVRDEGGRGERERKDTVYIRPGVPCHQQIGEGLKNCLGIILCQRRGKIEILLNCQL
jgi:hypothetical protein